MSTQKPPEEGKSDNEPGEWPAPDPEELRLLEEHLDQLEKEGVLMRGEGRRDNWEPVAYIPGAVERFFAARGTKPKPREQW
ncbi:MAG: hypothetical protein OXL37_09250 [Chloroflexota bacterium]|nr:hypothetical protein [Chloroflexota bacterium]MDE2960046.1 hypothetical protein [Chloroflexota bacterium]